jgi:hypothetical protein
MPTVERTRQTEWRLSTLEPRVAPVTSFWFRVHDGCQAVYMADVADSPAARRLSLLVGQAETLLPGAAMSWLNATHGHSPVDALRVSFLRDGIVHIAWAGLPAVYHRRRDGTVHMLRRPALPLGLVAEMKAPESIVMLDRGEALLIPNRRLECAFASSRTTPARLLSDFEVHEPVPGGHAERAATALIAERLDTRPLVAVADQALKPLEAAGV